MARGLPGSRQGANMIFGKLIWRVEPPYDARKIPDVIAIDPNPFVWGPIVILLAVIVTLGVSALIQMPGPSLAARVGVASLYCGCMGGLVLVRRANDMRLIWLGSILTLALALSMVPTFALSWSGVILEIFPFVVLYRLPRRWSLPLIAISTMIFIAAQLLQNFVRAPSSHATTNFWLATGTYAGLLILALTLRSRALTVQRLVATQRQLQIEIARTAELATIRERTRIAHDMHDVMAHSLTMLSMQVQATRQLVRRDPDRTERLLDDMASVLRESIAESRQLVSLLRTGVLDQSGSLAAQARIFAERFAERVGMQIAVAETGDPLPLESEREAAILFAMREGLTNAFRHGAARHAWVDLCWSAEQVTLRVRDDGSPQPGTAGGGNGLPGMRERAAALGGSAQAGSSPDGGYMIAFTVPIREEVMA